MEIVKADLPVPAMLPSRENIYPKVETKKFGMGERGGNNGKRTEEENRHGSKHSQRRGMGFTGDTQ